MREGKSPSESGATTPPCAHTGTSVRLPREASYQQWTVQLYFPTPEAQRDDESHMQQLALASRDPGSKSVRFLPPLYFSAMQRKASSTYHQLTLAAWSSTCGSDTLFVPVRPQIQRTPSERHAAHVSLLSLLPHLSLSVRRQLSFSFLPLIPYLCLSCPVHMRRVIVISTSVPIRRKRDYGTVGL